MTKAIIFDYDGVIIDSFKSVFEVYKGICKNYNVSCPATLEEFRVVYGYNHIECLKNLSIEEKYFTEAYEIYNNKMAKMEHGAFNGIADVIKELAKRYSIYIVTNSHSREVLSKIRKADLTKYFKKIYCGADEKTPKKDNFKKLLLENNYSAGEVISIGDRAVDYDASRAVGITEDRIILVDYGWGLNKSKIGNSRIANNPGEILDSINQFNNIKTPA